MVAPLVLVLALAVVQLALALHVRTTLTAAAAEGARAAALAGHGPAEGRARVTSLLADSVAAGVVTGIEVGRRSHSELDVTEVQVTARLPLLGLLGPESLVVRGHALQERS